MHQTDVQTYNEMALEVNAPIYTYYAERIVERTGIIKGCCLDVGSGGGYLGLALAKITSLDFVFLDQSPAMLACAEKNIICFGCRTRARTLLGRVQAIPLRETTIDLVVSRGSLPFWDNLPTAFGEIHRVMRPGGYAYIGGGLGDPARRDDMEQQLLRRYPKWRSANGRPAQRTNQEYRAALHGAGIDPFWLNRGDEGLWITFCKYVETGS